MGRSADKQRRYACEDERELDGYKKDYIAALVDEILKSGQKDDNRLSEAFKKISRR